MIPLLYLVVVFVSVSSDVSLLQYFPDRTFESSFSFSVHIDSHFNSDEGRAITMLPLFGEDHKFLDWNLTAMSYSTFFFFSPPLDLITNNDYTYVLFTNELVIYDTNNRSDPLLIGDYQFGDEGFLRMSLDEFDNLLFVGSEESGWRILDISNKSQPSLIFQNMTVNINDILFREGLLYILTTTDVIEVYEISTTLSPPIIFLYDYRLNTPTTRIYVPVGGLCMYTISKSKVNILAKPTNESGTYLLGSYESYDESDVVDINVMQTKNLPIDAFALVLTETNVESVNLTDRSNPNEIGYFHIGDDVSPASPISLVQVGNIILIGLAARMLVLDVSSLEYMREISSYSDTSLGGLIKVDDDNYLYSMMNNRNQLEISKYGDIQFFSSSKDKNDICDRAYEIHFLATDQYTNILKFRFSSLPSFYVNVDCTPGPSVISSVEHVSPRKEETRENIISVMLSEPLKLNISSVSHHFYGTYGSGVSISLNKKTSPDWIGSSGSETFLNSSNGIFSRSTCTSNGAYGGVSTKLFYLKDEIEYFPKDKNLIFVAEQKCFRIISFTDDGDFVWAESHSSKSSEISFVSLYVKGWLLFLASGVQGVQIQTIWDLHYPQYVNQIQDSNILNAVDILIYNDRYLYVCDQGSSSSSSSTSSGIKIYDVSNINHIFFVNKTYTKYSCKRILVDHENRILYVLTSSRVDIMRLGHKGGEEPVLISSIHHKVDTINFQNQYLYLVTSYNELCIYDVSSLVTTHNEPPKLISYLILFNGLTEFNVVSIGVRGTQLFLACNCGLETSVTGRIMVVETLDILNPYVLHNNNPNLPEYIPTNPHLNDLLILSNQYVMVSEGITSKSSSYGGVELYLIDDYELVGTPIENNCDSGIIEFVVSDNFEERSFYSYVSVDGCDNNGEKKKVGKSKWVLLIIIIAAVSIGLLICSCVYILSFICIFSLVVASCCIFVCSNGCSGIFYCCFKSLGVENEVDGEVGEYYSILGGKRKRKSSINNSDGDDGRRNGVKKLSFRIQKDGFEIDYNEIKLLEVVGAGGGGCVIYQGKWMGKIVCIKMFKKRSLLDEADEGNFDVFERELSMMASVSHPNILRWYGCTLKYPMVGIVMEFCENGDLRECILLKKLESIEERIRVLKEICMGMKYLHSRKIIHRDLKPQNVLLDRNLVVKIMDFGLSRSLSGTDDKNMLTKHIGTAYFMAPELVIRNPNLIYNHPEGHNNGGLSYSYPVDVFAYSVLIYLVITKRKKPYGVDEKTEDSGYGTEWKVAHDPDFRPKIEGVKGIEELMGMDFGWLIHDVMVRGWNHDPLKRPTFAEIQEMFDLHESDGKKKKRRRDGYEEIDDDEGQNSDLFILNEIDD